MSAARTALVEARSKASAGEKLRFHRPLDAIGNEPSPLKKGNKGWFIFIGAISLAHLRTSKSGRWRLFKLHILRLVRITRWVAEDSPAVIRFLGCHTGGVNKASSFRSCSETYHQSWKEIRRDMNRESRRSCRKKGRAMAGMGTTRDES